MLIYFTKNYLFISSFKILNPLNFFWTVFDPIFSLILHFFFINSDNWSWEQNPLHTFFVGQVHISYAVHFTRFVSFWSLLLVCHSIHSAWDGVFLPNELIWLIFTVAAVVIASHRWIEKGIFIKCDCASLCIIIKVIFQRFLFLFSYDKFCFIQYDK